MLDEKTINDFGKQWNRFTDNSGYHASVELLEDHIYPLMSVNDIKDKHVAEIGSGAGRIAGMLLDAGAASVTALEPSDAFEVLVSNVPNAIHIRGRGEELPLNDFDIVLSIGVLHHIEDPDPVVKRAFSALREGGKLVIWLYAYEGNETYLKVALPIRNITRRTPDGVLAVISHIVAALILPYIWACRLIPLPMQRYMRGYFQKLPHKKRVLTIFDQLNPAYARYYKKTEAMSLLERNGFSDISINHRHGYSWTVVGTKSSVER